MTNIAEKLKNCPKGTKLYSPLFGEVEFEKVTSQDDDYPIVVITITRRERYHFDMFGRYNRLYHAECLLFPSKDHRTWEDWEVPKPHYDISNFKPFDKVLVRQNDDNVWGISLFSRCEDNEFCTCNNVWFNQCITYEGNEALLGTTDMCDECYINW